jgi:hypothetical protein
MAVKVPATYTEESVVVRIVKGNITFDMISDVVDGFAVVDITGDMPPKLMNGYASPMYEVILFNPVTNEILELQSSGDPVTSVIFQIVSGQTSDTSIIIEY